VCTTVSDSEKESFVRNLGAEKVIRYREEDFTQEALEWTGWRGVDLAVDTVGGDTFFRTIPAVRLYGRIVTLLGPKESSWGEARMRSLDLAWEMVLTPMYYGIDSMKIHHRRVLENCASLFDDGRLTVTVAKVFPLALAREAHTALEEGHTVGKLVLSVD
jgi:NADPH2:quinone reductase